MLVINVPQIIKQRRGCTTFPPLFLQKMETKKQGYRDITKFILQISNTVGKRLDSFFGVLSIAGVCGSAMKLGSITILMFHS